ncbi:hypothetical protein HN51_046675 [Arachis hypogaea]|uniref:Uncharacterized protein n=1 Tax=Arachis hypogaea TaxID=3818 RepID=A0A445ADN8_ARAHY|nr:hypothetical protein Ahy_B02g058034 [Arachis hypogaea]
MKVHPVVPRKCNITIQFSVDAAAASGKKLRHLPHIFSRGLELPVWSDADVAIQEAPDCFHFVVKIVVGDSGPVEFSLNDLELDMWRFRLPNQRDRSFPAPCSSTASSSSRCRMAKTKKRSRGRMLRGLGMGTGWALT